MKPNKTEKWIAIIVPDTAILRTSMAFNVTSHVYRIIGSVPVVLPDQFEDNNGIL
jgi:uncharacterized protein YbaR (Trm112 family)